MFCPVIIILAIGTSSAAASKKYMLEFNVPEVVNDIAKITGLGDNLVKRTQNMPNNVKLEVETPNVKEILRSVGDYITEPRKHNLAVQISDEKGEPTNNGNIMDLINEVDLSGIVANIGNQLKNTPVPTKRNVMNNNNQNSDESSDEELNNKEANVGDLMKGVNLKQIISDIGKGLQKYVTVEYREGPNRISDAGDVNLKAQLNYNRPTAKQKQKENIYKQIGDKKLMLKHIRNNMKKKSIGKGKKDYQESLENESRFKLKQTNKTSIYKENPNNNKHHSKKSMYRSRRFLDNTIGEKYYTYPEMAPGIYKTRVIAYPPYYHQNRVRALLEIKARNDKLKDKWRPG